MRMMGVVKPGVRGMRYLRALPFVTLACACLLLATFSILSNRAAELHRRRAHAEEVRRRAAELHWLDNLNRKGELMSRTLNPGERAELEKVNGEISSYEISEGIK